MVISHKLTTKKSALDFILLDSGLNINKGKFLTKVNKSFLPIIKIARKLLLVIDSITSQCWQTQININLLNIFLFNRWRVYKMTRLIKYSNSVRTISAFVYILIFVLVVSSVNICGTL
jgi:hypothetical protein